MFNYFTSIPPSLLLPVPNKPDGFMRTLSTMLTFATLAVMLCFRFGLLALLML